MANMQTYQFTILCLMNFLVLVVVLSNFQSGLESVWSCPKSSHIDTRVKVLDTTQHKFVTVKGLNLHVAELGTGPNVVVFLHGFPEVWYSWRHQMAAVADSGYRAIAPDYRGYGLSQQPHEPETTTYKDFVDDLADTLDSLGISKVFFVSKDCGTRVANQFALMHPHRVRGIITIGLPFLVMTPETFPTNLIPEGYYMMRWQEPGRAEKDFARFDVRTVIRRLYILFSRSDMPEAKKNQEIMDIVDSSTPLPSWFTEEDLTVYASLYANNGFRTPLQVPYRAWMEDYVVTDLKVRTPSLLITGDKDYVLKFGGLENYIKSGKVRDYVPNLETVFVRNGTHFVQEQFPTKVNSLILNFLVKHSTQ